MSLSRQTDAKHHHLRRTTVDGFDFHDDEIDLGDGWRLTGPSAGSAVDFEHFARHRWR